MRAAAARNAFVNAALEVGFVAYLPVCAGSADVILYRRKDGELRTVLLRDTWRVDDEHERLEVSIGFEVKGAWYLVPLNTLGFHAGQAAVREGTTALSYDLARFSDEMIAELDDYRLDRMRSPTIFDRPAPCNAALLACFEQPFRNCHQGGEGADGAIDAFVEVCWHAGWSSLGYDDEAVEIASSHADEARRLGSATPHRLASVLSFLHSAERHAGGWFEGAIRSGLLRTITHRAGKIAAEAARRGAPVLAERITGALLGAAVGDALGLPVNRLATSDIQKQFGPDGVTGFVEAFGRVGALSGEAQLMLSVAQGIAAEAASVDDQSGPPARFTMLLDAAVELDRVRKACLEWHLGQTGRAEAMQPCLVAWHPFLRERRPHGRTTAVALEAGAATAANDSKGNGCMLRVVPIGLAHLMTMPDEVFRRAWNVAGLTHGHPVAKAAAGVFAVLLSRLACRQALSGAIECALDTVPNDAAGMEVRALVDTARLLGKDKGPTEDALGRIGAGYLAAEALGIALYCVLTTSDFEAAVLAAVNHSGDSDATGAMAGALAGALYGTNAIPVDLLRELEGRDVLIGAAVELALCTDLPPWTEGAIGENAYEEMFAPEDDARDAEQAIRDAVKAGQDLEGAIGAFAPDLPAVAAKMRRWAKRRRKGRPSGQADLLSG